MRLAKLSEFRRVIYTPESAPARKTLRRRIDAGKLPGGLVQNGHYYVDLDEFDHVTGLRQKACERKAELEAEPLLAGLI